MKRFIVLGSGGQLGTDLCVVLSQRGCEFYALDHSMVDVRDHGAVAKLVAAHGPATVINTTAFRNLSACEDDPAEAFAVNAIAVRNLASVCVATGSRLVHISTDYVFDGAKSTPYDEDDSVNPINVYGVSKAAGESLIRPVAPDHVIVRTSGLFGVAGVSGKGDNFVETMLRLGREQGRVRVVTDQTLSPTYTSDLAQIIVELAVSEARGTFHTTNAGACSRFEFALAIFAHFEFRGVSVEPVTAKEFGDPVVRPAYSVLDNCKLVSAGFTALRPWQEALTAYLQAKGHR